MKTNSRENWSQNWLANPTVYETLHQCDADFAASFHLKRCLKCATGVLHQANYERKPRGGAKSDSSKPADTILRQSFCCSQEGCRKRHTPPSLRFIGRKVYWSVVFVLAAALMHGLKPERVALLRDELGIDRRTLDRWRSWWLEAFVRSQFWKEARARFARPLDESALPLSLCEAFVLDRLDRFLDMLRFLRPLSAASWMPTSQVP